MDEKEVLAKLTRPTLVSILREKKIKGLIERKDQLIDKIQKANLSLVYLLEKYEKQEQFKRDKRDKNYKRLKEDLKKWKVKDRIYWIDHPPYGDSVNHFGIIMKIGKKKLKIQQVREQHEPREIPMTGSMDYTWGVAPIWDRPLTEVFLWPGLVDPFNESASYVNTHYEQ